MPRPKLNGRPAEEEEKGRVHQLLEVASQVFLESGYEAASTTEIAKRARSSKQTFYSRFPTKEKLFLAVIDHRTSKIAEQFSFLFQLDHPIEKVLFETGRVLLFALLSKDYIGLVRLVYMHAPQFPAVAKHFVERGPDRCMGQIADYLKLQMRAGVLVREDSFLAAQQFSGLLVGDLMHRALLGISHSLSKRLLEARAKASVEAFLQIYKVE